MRIVEVTENKKQYLDLLLLADEQEDMVDRYLYKSDGYFYFEGGVRYERNRLQRSSFVGEDEIFRYYCIDRSIRPGGKIAAFLPAPFQSRSFRDIISLHEKNEDTGRRKNAVAGISPG